MVLGNIRPSPSKLLGKNPPLHFLLKHFKRAAMIISDQMVLTLSGLINYPHQSTACVSDFASPLDPPSFFGPLLFIKDHLKTWN